MAEIPDKTRSAPDTAEGKQPFAIQNVENNQAATHALVEVIIKYAWVVGPRYVGKIPRANGFRAVKRWNVIGLDGEDEYTILADTSEELLDKVRKFEADAEAEILRSQATKAAGGD